MRVDVCVNGVRLPYHKTPIAERIVDRISAAVAGKEGSLRRLLDPDRFEEAFIDPDVDRDTFEPLFRDTANPTIVRAGAKFNVILSQATIELDTRLLPDGNVDDLVGEIHSRVDEDIEVEVVAAGPAAPPDFDDTLFPTLASILEEQDPAGIPIPFLFNESPDGRLFHKHGIQHYGFLPMDLPPEIDLPAHIHGPNERVTLSAADFGAEALYRLISRY